MRMRSSPRTTAMRWASSLSDILQCTAQAPSYHAPDGELATRAVASHRSATAGRSVAVVVAVNRPGRAASEHGSGRLSAVCAFADRSERRLLAVLAEPSRITRARAHEAHDAPLGVARGSRPRSRSHQPATGQDMARFLSGRCFHVVKHQKENRHPERLATIGTGHPFGPDPTGRRRALLVPIQE